MNLAEEVYYSMLGEMVDEFKVPWVENAFAPGSSCEQNYAAMLDAYERLLGRLGVEEDDDDVEIIINSLLENQKILGRKMFACGVWFAENKPRP